MINAIIVDDEIHPRETIKKVINQYYNEISIIAEADSMADGLQKIRNNSFDLLFLDIDLKDGTGFDLLEKIKPVNFKVIFVTGFHEYAIKAFKFSALDYILKPVNISELKNAIDRAISEIKSDNQSLKFETLFSNFKNSGKETKKIVLKTQESIFIVNVQDIIRCQSDNSYVTFFLNDGKKIIVTNSLKEYEEILSVYGFYRVHQSHLINFDYIQKFEKKDGGTIVMTDNSNVTVSQRKRQELLDLLSKL